MKCNAIKFLQVIIYFIVFNYSALPQAPSGGIKQFILDNKDSPYGTIVYPTQVMQYYAAVGGKTAWLQSVHLQSLSNLLNALKMSAQKGLNEKDYQYRYLQRFINGMPVLKNAADSLEAEVRITDAAIHFCRDIYFGNTRPVLSYDGLKYTPDCVDIPALLPGLQANNMLPLLSNNWGIQLPEINLIENKIRWMTDVLSDKNFSEITITTSKATPANQPLISKLFQLGIIDSANKLVNEKMLKQYLKDAQLLFDLFADGVMRSTLLMELNIPLHNRLQQLNLAVNYYRWLNCLNQNKPVIVVNLPAAYLKVYSGNKVIAEMRVIVGKKSTPTPTLAGSVSEVILYPYWYVPFSIATKEILPILKRKPGYINTGNYQVLNSMGKIVDPYTVNWRALSSGYFPYTIRQNTGCDNSLGVLKLNFYNPFDVYLHDTPGKNLFSLQKRFFSHGCMRIQKPSVLGHLVLKNNAVAIDTLEARGCLRNQSPIIVKAEERMPVIVWYNPVATDSLGHVIFYQDIYKRLNQVKNY
jgi:L,D-transpeptidase YcbB